jgi:hypothetical protein
MSQRRKRERMPDESMALRVAKWGRPARGRVVWIELVRQGPSRLGDLLGMAFSMVAASLGKVKGTSRDLLPLFGGKTGEDRKEGGKMGGIRRREYQNQQAIWRQHGGHALKMAEK